MRYMCYIRSSRFGPTRGGFRDLSLPNFLYIIPTLQRLGSSIYYIDGNLYEVLMFEVVVT